MKKVLKTLLVLAMLCALTIALVGCGNDEKTNKDNTVNNESNVNNDGTTVKISRGEWKGNKYVNEFAGVTFNMPEGWAKYSDEEIAQLMNIGVEALNQEQKDIAELLEQTAVYGMVVNDPATAANVMIMIEKPVLKVTAEYYLSSVKQQLENVQEIDYEIGESYTTKLGDSEFYRVDAQAEFSGITMGQYYFVKAVDDYIVAVIATTTGEGQIDEIVKCFE